MIFSTLLISTLFVLGRSEGEEGEDEAVVTLTTENFDSFIAENPRVLVEFYAPWCGHCKALAPEYEKAAQAIAADDSLDAVLAKVDATVEEDLAGKYDIGGFPTLKFFTGGDVENPTDYSGGRSESTIIQWVRTRSMPAVSILASSDEVDTFKTKGQVVLVGFFKEGSDEAKALNDVAEANRDSVVVGQVQDESVKVDGTEFGKLYLFRDFEDPVVAFDGTVSLEGITDFLNVERFPLIDAIGPENYADYVDRGLPFVWIALNGDEEDEKESIIQRLTQYAKDAKGKLSFTWVDAQKFAQHVQSLGITETPGILIAGNKNKKYLFEGDVTSADDLKAFFDGYSAGYVDRGLPLVWIALNVDDEDEKKTVIDGLTPHAKDAKGKLSFTWVDAQKYAQHVQNLGITETPGILIAGDNNKKFKFEGDVTSADDLKAFFDGYAAGTLTAHIKSEPVPESNEEPVFVLVGSEFENVVGKDKDVFVEFYAPWCGHCKALAPEYEKVGEAFSDVESVVIAKIDATENDTPEEIEGFPTLIFYPSYAAGTLTAHLKSEPVPESNEDPVFVLVGSEFENVIGKDKDVFVEFYAPWCGHCKRLAPEYEKVGEAFSEVDSVVIAKIDATENDTPEDIKGFPTLIFYPKGTSEGVKYNGDRKQEAIIEWIKEKASGDVSKVKTEL
eukprot:CAMPEP_0197072014 /NCGR_PEP_ID=MMETSP1384-20130603/209877_1 /TAXON_ID=29189 /ORGANISM="Ammonia sp." /LENGTH=672 /DNA_ID=CAMNT_0042510827 /DNA_START=72 /DNA_END=2091 /DNA_ORIENTATION=-